MLWYFNWMFQLRSIRFDFLYQIEQLVSEEVRDNFISFLHARICWAAIWEEQKFVPWQFLILMSNRSSQQSSWRTWRKRRLIESARHSLRKTNYLKMKLHSGIHVWMFWAILADKTLFPLPVLPWTTNGEVELPVKYSLTWSMMEKLAQFWFKICEWRLTSSISFNRRRSTPNVHDGIWNLLECSSTMESISDDMATSSIVENCSCCCCDTTGILMMCFSASCDCKLNEISFWWMRKCSRFTFNSFWMLDNRRFISPSNDDELSSGFVWRPVFCTQIHLLESSWLMSTVLLTSCSTTVVKYESFSSFVKTSTKLNSNEFNSSSMFETFSFSTFIDFNR